jgi:hypothetical protein
MGIRTESAQAVDAAMTSFDEAATAWLAGGGDPDFLVGWMFGRLSRVDPVLARALRRSSGNAIDHKSVRQMTLEQADPGAHSE